ncbi:MAG: phage major capsid protein, partial [Planctomycetota bacterium]
LGGNSVVTMHDGKITPSFLGYPIVFTPILHTGTGVQTDGSPLFLFGDMRMASIIGDRRGFALKVSDQRYMELDQIGITATTRFDIVNHGIGTTSAAGPMVALLANAA